MQRHGIKAIMTNKPSVYNSSSHASRHNITWHYPPKSLSNLPAPSSLGGSREMGGGEDGRGKGGGGGEREQIVHFTAANSNHSRQQWLFGLFLLLWKSITPRDYSNS